MISLIQKSGIRFFRKHPLQLALSILGIAIGVSVVVAVDIAQSSSRKAFDLSLQTVSGRATHTIRCSPVACGDELYRKIRRDLGFKACAPVVDEYVQVLGAQPRMMRLIGLDPFADNPFREFTASFQRVDIGMEDFIARGNGVVLSSRAMDRMGLETGDGLRLQISGLEKKVTLLGGLESGEGVNPALDDLIIADISTAQELLDLNGKLSRIDLILDDTEESGKILSEIQSILTPTARVERVGRASEEARVMTSAFRINLRAMSLLSMIVGAFLIFNTLSFSVVQRREMIGLLRAQGVTRKEIFRKVLGEALIFGWVGSLIGILLGILMSRSFLQIVLGTINNLYFTVSLENPVISFWTLARGYLLGTGVSLVSALVPARQMTRFPPGVLIQRSYSEQAILKKIPRFTLSGFGFLLLTVIISIVPSRSAVPGFIAMFTLIIGLSLLGPGTTRVIIGLLLPLVRRMKNVHAVIGVHSISRYMSRTAIAIASLAIAVSVTIGVGTMIESFRDTVVNWLGSRLSSDIYITAPGNIQNQLQSALPLELSRTIEKIPGVHEISHFRAVELPSDRGLILVNAVRGNETEAASLTFKESMYDTGTILEKFETGEGAILSASLAYRKEISLGESVTLRTPDGPIKFHVIAIQEDYSGDRGQVMISDTVYRRLWDDDRVSGISANLVPGADQEKVKQDIREAAGGRELVLQSGRSLLEYSITVFDRTFMITYVLQFIAIMVAFIAILSSLTALQLERRKELGVMRAIGLSRRELMSQVFIQTVVTGLIAGLLSIPLGNAMSFILIHVINRRSFGWDFPFSFQPDLNLYAVLLSLLSAMLAAVYPALKMARQRAAEALREA